jgi:hypothetical protein
METNHKTVLRVGPKRPWTATERTRKRRAGKKGRVCRDCGRRALNKFKYRCDVCQAVENLRAREAYDNEFVKKEPV